MNTQEQLSKKGQYDAERHDKLAAKEAAEKKYRFKKIILWSLGSILAVAVITGFVWYIATKPATPESDIVSRTGFHWHPELTIYIKGKRQEIPPNIGLGAVHQPIHTHEDSDKGIIHMEFQGVVRKQDTALGRFFEIWGKDMRSFGQNMRMMVNGKENTEYENYPMKDKDKIELYYE